MVLPAGMPVTLRVSGRNRAGGVEVSVDGVRLGGLGGLGRLGGLKGGDGGDGTVTGTGDGNRMGIETGQAAKGKHEKDGEVGKDGNYPKGWGLGVGMEVRVWSERLMDDEGRWVGGVPAIVREASASAAAVAAATSASATTASGTGRRSVVDDMAISDGDDHWVGGLNGLLKFNYPFGEEEEEGKDQV